MHQNCDNLHPTSRFTGSYVWVYENRRWTAHSIYSVSPFPKQFNCLLVICCPLLAAQARQRCPLTQPPWGRAGAGIEGSAPSATLTGWCPRETEIGKRGTQALQTLLARVDSCHLPETQHSSPQHRCCGIWGLIYHFVTQCTLSRWYLTNYVFWDQIFCDRFWQ